MIALSLIVIYFRAPIAAYVTQYIDQRDVEVDRIGEQPSQIASLPINGWPTVVALSSGSIPRQCHCVHDHGVASTKFLEKSALSR